MATSVQKYSQIELPPRLTDVLRLVLTNRGVPVDISGEFDARLRLFSKRQAMPSTDSFTWSFFSRMRSSLAPVQTRTEQQKIREKFAMFVKLSGQAVGDDGESFGIASVAAKTILRIAVRSITNTFTRFQIKALISKEFDIIYDYNKIEKALKVGRELYEWLQSSSSTLRKDIFRDNTQFGQDIEIATASDSISLPIPRHLLRTTNTATSKSSFDKISSIGVGTQKIRNSVGTSSTKNKKNISNLPSSTPLSGSNQNIKADAQWLVCVCEQHLALAESSGNFDGTNIWTAQTLAEQVISLFRSDSDDSQLQADLFGLFGVAGFDTIAELFQRKDEIVDINLNELFIHSTQNVRNSVPISVPKGPHIGLRVTSKAEKNAEKQERKRSRRFGRHMNAQSKNNQVHMNSGSSLLQHLGFSEEYLDEQHALGLKTLSKSRTFSFQVRM